MMLRSAMLASALAMAMVSAAEARVTLNDDNADVRKADGLLLAQGDGGSGGSGDSAGRGPDTSKGAVPTNPKDYPSGITSPGTSPVPPSPQAPQGKPAEGSSAVAPSGNPGTTTGTGLKSPGTTQQGGDTRTDR